MNKYLMFLLLGTLVIQNSCDDVIVEDISKEKVSLRAPSDGYITSEPVKFWWDFVEGAEKYQLLVVTPDLENTDVLVLDTLVSKDQFEFEVPAGKYQWCVRGVNSAYETAYTCRNLEITN